MTLFIFLSLIALGIGSGFLAGLLGIGGGMIITPFLSVLLTMQGVPAEYAMHAAIATSLSIILFTSMSSARAHNRNHFVLWNVFWGIAPGILVGAALGAQIASYLPTFWITLIFIIFVGFSAVKMFFDLKPKPTNTLPGKPGLFAVGTVIGGLSGIVGAGGGFISVPFMVRSNVEMHHAVGTSAALGFPIALAGTIGYIYESHGDARMDRGLYSSAVTCLGRLRHDTDRSARSRGSQASQHETAEEAFCLPSDGSRFLDGFQNLLTPYRLVSYLRTRKRPFGIPKGRFINPAQENLFTGLSYAVLLIRQRTCQHLHQRCGRSRGSPEWRQNQGGQRREPYR